MPDLYTNLIAELDNRHSANAKTREKNRQDIKRIAEKLREQILTIDSSLDASFCYYISGYYVHAQVLANVDVKNAHPIQRWILYFLSKRFSELKTDVSLVVSDAQFQDSNIRKAVYADTLKQSEVVNLIIEVKVAECFLDIISFIETGNTDRYAHAVDVLSVCQKLLHKAGEWQIWWWIEALKIIGQEFIENSLWQVLQLMCDSPTNSEVVSKYITANYEKLKIVEFWRTQIESLPKINDPERCSFCISIPTSAGKTKAAELAVLRFLLDYWNESETKCVYIAPLRSLCEEVEKSFYKVFGQFSKSLVSSFYGGHETDVFDEHLWAKTRILVVTPEKMDGLLRLHPAIKSQIRLVIADEGHLIGDKDRLTYRFLLERLIYLFRTKGSTADQKPRIVLLSGVLPNAEDVAKLISGSVDNIVRIEWRPTDEPKFYKWVWNKQGWTSWKFENGNWRDSISPTPDRIQNCNSQDKFADHVVKTAVSESKSDKAVMVFSASKKAIENSEFKSLLSCVALQAPLGTADIVNPKLKTKHPDEALLLESHIAVHHSNLPQDLRQEIDQRVKSNRVRLLFATSTVAQGVNMPFDEVLIYNIYHQPNLPIKPSMFWNVVGRVGRPIAQIKTRAKIEPPKVVFLVDQSNTLGEEKCDELVRSQGKYKIQSPFFDFLIQIKNTIPAIDIPKLVEALAEKPKLKEIIGERASTLWGKLTLEQCLSELDRHLIALTEEVDENVTLEWAQIHVGELVELFTQSSVITNADIDFISQVVLARLRFIAMKIPKSQRQQEYLLGLPFDDCEKIKENQKPLMKWYQDSVGLFSNNREVGISALINLVMFVMELSICKTRKSKKTSNVPNLSKQMTFDLKVDDRLTETQKKLLGTWINGESDDDLLSKRQEFKKHRDLERNIPWGLSAIGRYLKAVIQEQEDTQLTADLEYLPSMVKYGVNSKLACHLIRLHIPRKFAIHIADAFSNKLTRDEDESGESFNSDFVDAVSALQTLTSNEIDGLGIDQRTVGRIQEILEKFPSVDNTIEPEFPPFEEMEFAE